MVERAKAQFAHLGFKVLTGARYLGGYIGDKAACTQWVDEKVMRWVAGVNALSKVAKSSPQCAFAGLEPPIRMDAPPTVDRQHRCCFRTGGGCNCPTLPPSPTWPQPQRRHTTGTLPAHHRHSATSYHYRSNSPVSAFPSPPTPQKSIMTRQPRAPPSSPNPSSATGSSTIAPTPPPYKKEEDMQRHPASTAISSLSPPTSSDAPPHPKKNQKSKRNGDMVVHHSHHRQWTFTVERRV